MILMLYRAMRRLRPRCTGRLVLRAMMICIRRQRRQEYIGHAFRFLGLRLLLQLQRDRWSLSVHARLRRLSAATATTRGNIFASRDGPNSSRRRGCLIPPPSPGRVDRRLNGDTDMNMDF